MAKIFRKEVAGNLVRACCFTMPLPRDTALERAEKQKMTSAARARMNVKTSWEKCRLTAAAGALVKHQNPRGKTGQRQR